MEHSETTVTTSPEVNGADPLLIEFLAERSVACPVCGYDLRLLQRPECPECGETIALRIMPREPHLAAFLTGMIGLSVAAGPSAIFVLIIGYFAISDPGNRMLLGFLMVTLPIALISGTALIIWLRSARRLRRSSDATRWFLAILCWIPGPVGVVLTMLYRLNA